MITAVAMSLLVIAVLIPVGLVIMSNADMGGTTTYPGYDTATLPDVSVAPVGDNYSFEVNYLSELGASQANWDFTVHCTEKAGPASANYTVSIHVNKTVNATNFGTWTLTGDATKHIYLTHVGVTLGTAVIYIYAVDDNDSLVGAWAGTVTVQADPTQAVTVGAVDPVLIMLVVIAVPLFAMIGLALVYIPKLR